MRFCPTKMAQNSLLGLSSEGTKEHFLPPNDSFRHFGAQKRLSAVCEARMLAQGSRSLVQLPCQNCFLSDFLNIYVSQSNDVATSVTAYLEVRGDTAHFGEGRVFRPTIAPSQNDGFMISLALSILEHALGSQLDPDRVVLVVFDPSVLPERFEEFQVLRGDWMGFRIQFPSQWLALPLEGAMTSRNDRVQDDGAIDAGFLAGFRGLLRRHIGHGGLNADEAAELVAMSRWQLARQLTLQGTYISSEIARAKWDVAKERLIHGEQTIEEISAALGYADPANFSRAFAREFQQTPSKFRRAQRQQAK
jgi:AraC-like DNA-binding protein